MKILIGGKEVDLTEILDYYFGWIQDDIFGSIISMWPGIPDDIFARKKPVKEIKIALPSIPNLPTIETKAAQNKKVLERFDLKDFMTAMAVIGAAIVKSDSKIGQIELSYIRNFMATQFGSEATDKNMQIFEQMLSENYAIDTVVKGIRKDFDYEVKLHLLYALFCISNADYAIANEEISSLKTLAKHFEIQNTDFESIKAMFLHEADAEYKILGISPSVDDQSVKIAFKIMNEKFNPSKMEAYSEGSFLLAQEKYNKFLFAYEQIKYERNMA